MAVRYFEKSRMIATLQACPARLVPAPRELEEGMRRFVVPADGSRGFVLSLALIALTPAICEEALFRGAILRGFAAGLPRIMAAVITGLLFGLFHLDLWRLLPTALLGIALSLIALETWLAASRC